MTTIRAEFNLEGWDSNRLRDRVPVILRRYADRLGTEFKEQIRAVRYDWPRETERSDGRKVGSPRDIVDTKAFINSQVRRDDGDTQIRFVWGGGSVTYAGYILNGIPDRNYPARDWISPALDRHPIERFFRDEWNRLGSLGL
jgi:hypothetical protein